MTRYLLLFLFIGTMGSRMLGLDFGLAPGISIKNIFLYATLSMIAVESVMAHDRQMELLPVFLPFALLIVYALITWLITVLLLENPHYDPTETLIRLKIKLVDQFLMLLVFFYGVVNWKSALWLLKALVWVVIIGCFVTVVDTFNIPDLGIIAARDSDGRVEGILGSSGEFGGLLAFFLPATVALWWTETGPKKLLALIGIGLALVSVLLTATRGAMLGVVAGAIIAAFYLRHYISSQIFVRATMAALVLTVIAVLVVLSSDFTYVLQTRLSTGLATGDLETLSSGRTAIWSAAFRAMAEQPISFFIGFGWESYYQTIGHRYATHNVYLDRLYNLGIIGLALFTLIFFSTLAIARRGLRSAPGEASPFLVATVTGVTSFMIAMVFAGIEGAGPYVWAYTGLALRVAVTSSVAQRGGRPRSFAHE